MSKKLVLESSERVKKNTYRKEYSQSRQFVAVFEEAPKKERR